MNRRNYSLKLFILLVTIFISQAVFAETPPPDLFLPVYPGMFDVKAPDSARTFPIDTEFRSRLLSVEASVNLGLVSGLNVGAGADYQTAVVQYVDAYVIPCRIVISSTVTISASAYIGQCCQAVFIAKKGDLQAALKPANIGVSASISYSTESLSIGAYGYLKALPVLLPIDQKSGKLDIAMLKVNLLEAINKLISQDTNVLPLNRLVGLRFASPSDVDTFTANASTAKVELLP